MSNAIPPRRHRDHAVRYYPLGAAYVTYADWHSANPLRNNILPPHNYEAVSQFVHKEGLAPETKTAFHAAGVYWTGFYPAARYPAESNYWIGKASNIINWDIDTLYISGKFQQIVTYSDNPPHSAQHWSISTCAISDAITQQNYNDWAATGRTNNETVIGKKSVVVILYDRTQGYKVTVYALMSEVSLVLCYERLLPDYDRSTANDFFVVGFKTDALTLVYWMRLYPEGGGIYKLLFNDSYTSETRTKLGDTAYPIYMEVNTYHYDEQTYAIDATKNINSTASGMMIVDVFQHKDDFTIIYKKHSYDYSERYLFRNQHQEEAKTVDRSETHDFYSAFIDWKVGRVADGERLIFGESSTYNVNLTKKINEDGDVVYNGAVSTNTTLETKLLYAHHAKSLYVYRTVRFDNESRYNGMTALDSVVEQYKLIVKSGNVTQTLAQFDDTRSASANINPTHNYINAGNYGNLSASYPVEWYYYAPQRYAAFDGKLLACCFDLNSSDLSFGSNYRKRPKTLIFKSLQEYEIKDYRVDNDETRARFYPLTVTSIPKEVV